MVHNEEFLTSVVCIGSRERYGLPVTLHKLGLLDCLYTDIYMPDWVSSYANFVNHKGLKSLLSRHHPLLPSSLVRAQSILGLELRMKLRKANSLYERQVHLCHSMPSFSRSVIKGLSKGHSSQILGFSGQALEVYRYCKEDGKRVIHDQVDPGLYEWELVASEIDKNPGWECNHKDSRWNAQFEKRIRSELEIADDVIVNSEYSKMALEQWGITDKVKVLPIASSIPRVKRTHINSDSPLRVLFLGLLSIRKGVHIALTAVDNLIRAGKSIELVLAGESIIAPDKLRQFKGAEYIGPVPSSLVPALIDSCDVLLFPTFSDGFGMVQVEAISRGMPIISTPNAAQVIEDGVSGFIVSVGSVEEVENRLTEYLNDRDLLRIHSNNAYLRAELFSQKKFIPLVANILASKNRGDSK